jgi:hypothetical protein
MVTKVEKIQWMGQGVNLKPQIMGLQQPSLELEEGSTTISEESRGKLPEKGLPLKEDKI